MKKTPKQKTFDAGVLARQNREKLDACPHAEDDPQRVEWIRGWRSQITQESDSQNLAGLLEKFYKFDSSELEKLTSEQRELILDWFDTVPQSEDPLENDFDAFDSRKPEFVSIGEARSDGWQHLSFALPPPVDGENTAETPTPAPNTKPEPLVGDSAKLTKRLKRIEKANKYYQICLETVTACESRLKSAKGSLATAIEDRDAAGLELSRIISDVKAGQDPLPGMDEDELENPPALANTNPISELGSKQLRKLVGADTFDAAKNRDEPIGLSSNQLDKLTGAEIKTIEDLETRMRDVRDWWSILAKDPAAGIVTRVSDSVAAFRSKCPVKGPEPTCLENLAEQNAEAFSEPLAEPSIPTTPPTILEAAGVTGASA